MYIFIAAPVVVFYACMMGVPATDVVCEMDEFVNCSLGTEHRLAYNVTFAEAWYILTVLFRA